MVAAILVLSAPWSHLAHAAEPRLVLRWTDRAGQPVGHLILERSRLDAMPHRQVVTGTPWMPGIQRFRGPALSDVARLVARTVVEARVTAHNAYTAVIPRSDLDRYAPIVALYQDDEPMRLRNKGPFWIIYPIDSHPELRGGLYTQRMVWQVREIEFLVD
ncbi:hypothetical protein STVA_23070 [Allostella vacuolata]|nr:hypothetical protein STVA_23070 [Stella vacuolata]